MTVGILLALVATVFIATSAVAQRVAAAPAPGEIAFNWRILLYLLRRPVWFLGILCMIAGFIFQLAALHFSDLSLVQPIIATEILFVFAYLAIRGRRNHSVHPRDWIAAAGMAAGLGAFLFLARPTGDSTADATAWHWILAAACAYAAAGLVAAAAVAPRRRPLSPSRKAALLSISAGIAWGFAAAVIKELSTHISQGPYAVFTNWSPYALVISGAIAMFLVTNAYQAGPLAASQPGLTLVDPLVASLLGVTVFGEHLRTGAPYLVGEVFAGLILVGAVVLLGRSPLIQAEDAEGAQSAPDRPPDGAAGNPEEGGPAPGAEEEPVHGALSSSTGRLRSALPVGLSRLVDPRPAPEAGSRGP